MKNIKLLNNVEMNMMMCCCMCMKTNTVFCLGPNPTNN